MVFGQSGGGAKIATLMGTPAAAGLFHRAATMSGQQVTASGPAPRDRAGAGLYGAARRAIGRRSAGDAGGAAGRGAGARPTRILGGGVYFGPVLDMKWLVRHPFWPDANPQGNAIPMMLGNTHDETRAFYRAGSSEDRRPRLGQSRRADGAGAAHRRSCRNGSSPNIARLFPAYDARAGLLRRDHRRAQLARPGDRGGGTGAGRRSRPSSISSISRRRRRTAPTFRWSSAPMAIRPRGRSAKR